MFVKFIKKIKYFNINAKFPRDEGANMNKGEKLYKRAKRVIPGGTNLLSKKPEMFLNKNWPCYFQKVKAVKYGISMKMNILICA